MSVVVFIGGGGGVGGGCSGVVPRTYLIAIARAGGPTIVSGASDVNKGRQSRKLRMKTKCRHETQARVNFLINTTDQSATARKTHSFSFFHLVHAEALPVPRGLQVVGPHGVGFYSELFQRHDVLPDLGQAGDEFPVADVRLQQPGCELPCSVVFRDDSKNIYVVFVCWRSR